MLRRRNKNSKIRRRERRRGRRSQLISKMAPRIITIILRQKKLLLKTLLKNRHRLRLRPPKNTKRLPRANVKNHKEKMPSLSPPMKIDKQLVLLLMAMLPPPRGNLNPPKREQKRVLKSRIASQNMSTKSRTNQLLPSLIRLLKNQQPMLQIKASMLKRPKSLNETTTYLSQRR